jgi:hypothetical protein
MKRYWLIWSLLLFPAVGFTWSESNAECPEGYYCQPQEQKECAAYPESCHSHVMPKRCWWSDEDCEPGQRCIQKSEYIPGYCV